MQSISQNVTVSRYFNRTRFHSYINHSRLNGRLIMELFPFLRVFYEKEPMKTIDRVQYSQMSNFNIRPPNSLNNCEIYIRFQNRPQIALSFHCEDRQSAEYVLTTMTLMSRFTNQSTLLHSLCELQNSVVKILLQNPTFNYILKATATKFNQSFLQYRPLYQVYQRYKREIKEMTDIQYGQHSSISNGEIIPIQERLNQMTLVGYIAGSNIPLNKRMESNQTVETERHAKKVQYYYQQYRSRNTPKSINALDNKTTQKIGTISFPVQVLNNLYKRSIKNKADELLPSTLHTTSTNEQEINKLMTEWMKTDKKWTKKKKNLKDKQTTDKESCKLYPSQTEKAQKLLILKISKEKLLQHLQLPISPIKHLKTDQSNTQNPNPKNIPTNLNENNQPSDITDLKNATILVRYLYQMENGKAKRNPKALSKVLAELTQIKNKTKSEQCISFINKTLSNIQKYIWKPTSPNKMQLQPQNDITEIVED